MFSLEAESSAAAARRRVRRRLPDPLQSVPIFPQHFASRTSSACPAPSPTPSGRCSTSPARCTRCTPSSTNGPHCGASGAGPFTFPGRRQGLHDDRVGVRAAQGRADRDDGQRCHLRPNPRPVRVDRIRRPRRGDQHVQGALPQLRRRHAVVGRADDEERHHRRNRKWRVIVLPRIERRPSFYSARGMLASSSAPAQRFTWAGYCILPVRSRFPAASRAPPSADAPRSDAPARAILPTFGRLAAVDQMSRLESAV